ncbi:MAG: M14 family zinc carboxypeptidase, partial [Egibacteraceae bacterium]
RRLLHYLLENRNSRRIRRLLATTELWFVPVANPDGYDYTFTEGNRLWRKNLRDNDDDGEITGLDGVDLNRNFPYRWGWDNEGSSPEPSSQVYRGTGPASEPETQAMDRLLRRVGFEFVVNNHSAAELLLYGVSWQVATPTPDDIVSETLVGTDQEPAIPGFDPDLSAELYITNGDTTDHAHVRRGAISFTPEATDCQSASDWYPNDVWEASECESVFSFPDDERLIQREFDINLPFMLDVARSANNPDQPVSHLGNTAEPFRVDAFETSYGSDQTVETWARRALGRVEMVYSINGGEPQRVPTSEWDGGERYGREYDKWYAHMRGEVVGASAGDEVTIHFEGGGEQSESFTYTVEQTDQADVLIVADTDYTGDQIEGVDSLRYLDMYTSALEANGYTWAVFDVDAMNRTAPHPLGVLGHFDAVIWYTGDNLVTGYQGGLNIAKLAHDMNIVMRDYLNQGGKLMVTGKNAGFQEFLGAFYGTNGAPEEPCTSDNPFSDCLPISDDFYQYWLGAYSRIRRGGLDAEGEANGVNGVDRPYTGMVFGIDGPESADNQGENDDTASGTASFIPTSNILDPNMFPQFLSWRSAAWASEGAAPFEPHSGTQYMASQHADIAYKRMTRTIDLSSASAASLDFWTSYRTEADWDFFFVEAHTVGQDDWTTLPDTNGHTSQNTGQSCPSGWGEQLHPQLLHYQTPYDSDAGCAPTGTTGEWHATSGASDGYEQWSMDLSRWAGQQVEVSITYATDWGTGELGVFVDDTSVTVDGEVVSESSFEDDLDGWEVAGSPEGSADNPNDWIRSTALFEVAAAITTAQRDSLYLGFGFEGIATEAERNAVMGRSMGYLLP